MACVYGVRVRGLSAAVQACGHEQRDPCQEVVERGVAPGQRAEAHEEAGANEEGPVAAEAVAFEASSVLTVYAALFLHLQCMPLLLPVTAPRLLPSELSLFLVTSYCVCRSSWPSYGARQAASKCRRPACRQPTWARLN